MDSISYDVRILAPVQERFECERSRGKWPVWQQDNIVCHRSRLTWTNLESRNIPTISWPSCSPDLKLIKYVWLYWNVTI